MPPPTTNPVSRLMDVLHGYSRPLIEYRPFLTFVSLIFLLNPIALAPQVLTAITAPSVEGISIAMWFIFLLIQGAVMFQGIRIKDASMFVSMLLSMLESVSIIVIVFVRR